MDLGEEIGEKLRLEASTSIGKCPKHILDVEAKNLGSDLMAALDPRRKGKF